MKCKWEFGNELLNFDVGYVTGNVVISEVDVLTYVVLSEAQKHVLYGGN